MLQIVNKILLSLLFLFLTSCDVSEIFAPEITCIDNNTCDLELELYTNYDLDDNGYYYFELSNSFEGNTYGTVNLISTPMERIYWASPDSFTVVHMGVPVVDPIIQHSTYADDDGYGQQSFWIGTDFVGDTLTIYGSISSLIQTCEWYDGPEDCDFNYQSTTEKINIIIY